MPPEADFVGPYFRHIESQGNRRRKGPYTKDPIWSQRPKTPPDTRTTSYKPEKSSLKVKDAMVFGGYLFDVAYVATPLNRGGDYSYWLTPIGDVTGLFAADDPLTKLEGEFISNAPVEVTRSSSRRRSEVADILSYFGLVPIEFEN